jgi:hypothetical protein
MKSAGKKTKDYVLRATRNYQNKFDRIVVLAPMGTKDRIKATGAASVSAFINDAIATALEKMEAEQTETD